MRKWLFFLIKSHKIQKNNSIHNRYTLEYDIIILIIVIIFFVNEMTCVANNILRIIL